MSTSIGCWIIKAPTCWANSIPSIWTPISTTPSSWWSGVRVWSNGSPIGTSTSDSSGSVTHTFGSRPAGVVRREGQTCTELATRVTVDARAHAERLTPNALAALADAGLTMSDLDAVVVGCGPGPFTGLRAGMAAAAAYGHALDIPVHGVCSLDAIGTRTTGDTLVVTDARRREIYWARYQDGVRTEGPAVDAAADVDPGSARAVAGSPEHAPFFGLPVRQSL